jgi:hypothetical protein
LQRYPFESFQFANRARGGSGPLMNVELHDFVARDRAGVGGFCRDLQRRALSFIFTKR